jgi:glycine/D-amino acid oxidase-like deaminating enzyme
MRDVVVVGGGLFGSIAADALNRAGMDVMLIDDKRPLSGSKPAACLMKPSWLTSMTKDQLDKSYALLDEQYGLERIPFTLTPTRALDMSVTRIRPSKVWAAVNKPNLIYQGQVTRVFNHNNGVDISFGSAAYSITAKHVVLACGSWSHELVPWAPKPKPQAGWAFTWQDNRKVQPFISLWAPYRQLVVFNREDGEIWAGDGSALKPERLTDWKRRDESMMRCVRATFPTGVPSEIPGDKRTKQMRRFSEAEVIAGIRPYTEKSEGAPCFFETRGRVTVITGGAKNGTMAAGWCAARLKEMLL